MIRYLLFLAGVFFSVNAMASDLPTRYGPPPVINGGPGNKVGILSCQLDPSVGLIVVEVQKIQCSFTPDNSSQTEQYAGNMANVGVDLGITAAGLLTWGVYAPTKNLVPGSLAGKYVGIGIDATVVVGGGANFLLGGSENSVALQPWSVEGLAGANASLGLQDMVLRPAM
jgi:uncharacterized protein DUF992